MSARLVYDRLPQRRRHLPPVSGSVRGAHCLNPFVGCLDLNYYMIIMRLRINRNPDKQGQDKRGSSVHGKA
ncbi:hypothetical protein E2C01_062018 [Portunus trituberculatus]|uniref:Uncharacterized protein n=1 Tax=Portunus trituberculatus TaxID=210409 RepID=A0A5B7H9U9_PORTR|nr:hypothetical protein [Portunus trituberculatus]